MGQQSVKRIQARRSALAVAAALATLAASNAQAFKIETGDPDVEVRWDNTVKYNLGMRMQARDPALHNSATFSTGDNKFKNGDIVTNRVDVLSELDVVIKQRFGARVSGMAWYDAAYNDKEETNPNNVAGGHNFYPGGRYSDTVKRYYTKSGELLDAFIFGRIDVGDVPINVKFGRHTSYWGESLFSPIHGVSYSQGPVDFRKALATPGIEAKELFLPLNQISAQAQINDTVSVAAQYFLEWAPYRLPEGGTYLAGFDFTFAGGTDLFGTPYLGDRHSNKPGNRGSWGINTKLTPEWAQATIGLYYRNFDDKVPTVLGARPGCTTAMRRMCACGA